MTGRIATPIKVGASLQTIDVGYERENVLNTFDKSIKYQIKCVSHRPIAIISVVKDFNSNNSAFEALLQLFNAFMEAFHTFCSIK